MTPATNKQPDTDAQEVILSVKDVSVSFGRAKILDNLSLDVYRGEILGFRRGVRHRKISADAGDPRSQSETERTDQDLRS